MRKLVTWIVVSLGIAALVRRLKGRRGRAEPAGGDATGDSADDPAGELRRKLAESRSVDETPAGAAPSEDTVEERRADVHAAGRDVVDEMRSSGDDG